MITFDWNGLRRGDVLFVHLGENVQPATKAEVRLVERSRRRGPQRVAVHPDGTSAGVVWTSPPAVHFAEHPVAGACWRCDLLVRRQAGEHV